jgi:LmbE family N-acetylglucosaminyl deacetylase
VREPLPDGLVVVSPHLDDAILSLGASIARAARAARKIDVLTVFAGAPESTAPAGGWDRRGGFSTEGDAATARRLEDREACTIVGAEPTWLSFPDADYAATRDAETVWSAVAGVVDGAGAVLIPGFPLTNADHAWLARTLLRRPLPCGQIGLYAEQPYRYTERGRSRRPRTPDFVPQPESRWLRPAARMRDRSAKRRAILAYRSQMPLLTFSRDGWRKLDRMLRHEGLRRGERVVWLSAT